MKNKLTLTNNMRAGLICLSMCLGGWTYTQQNVKRPVPMLNRALKELYLG